MRNKSTMRRNDDTLQKSSTRHVSVRDKSPSPEPKFEEAIQIKVRKTKTMRRLNRSTTRSNSKESISRSPIGMNENVGAFSSNYFDKMGGMSGQGVLSSADL